MSELITVPTVEQINLEHQLANSKANEAVQHATNCGLMLLQVKASLNHGEWLPWLNGEIESGRLKVGTRQVQKYMRLGSNTNRSSYLLEAFETFLIPAIPSNKLAANYNHGFNLFETFLIPAIPSNPSTPETQIIQYAARVVSRK